MESYSWMLHCFFSILVKPSVELIGPEALRYPYGTGISGNKTLTVAVGARMVHLSSFHMDIGVVGISNEGSMTQLRRVCNFLVGAEWSDLTVTLGHWVVIGPEYTTTRS